MFSLRDIVTCRPIAIARRMTRLTMLARDAAVEGRPLAAIDLLQEAYAAGGWSCPSELAPFELNIRLAQAAALARSAPLARHAADVALRQLKERAGDFRAADRDYLRRYLEVIGRLASGRPAEEKLDEPLSVIGVSASVLRNFPVISAL